jgi:hypothetical protein
VSVLPGADEKRATASLGPQRGQQCRADPVPLVGGSHVRMPDQRDVGDVLDAHHPDQLAVLPEP